jgi:hypothetical protein
MLSSQTIGLVAAAHIVADPQAIYQAMVALRARQAAALAQQNAARTGGSSLADDTKKAGATTDNTLLYVGIGAGVLAVGGLAWYLSTHRKGRRRR